MKLTFILELFHPKWLHIEYASGYVNEYLLVKVSVTVFLTARLLTCSEVKLYLVRSCIASMVLTKNIKFGREVALVSGKCLTHVP